MGGRDGARARHSACALRGNAGAPWGGADPPRQSLSPGLCSWANERQWEARFLARQDVRGHGGRQRHASLAGTGTHSRSAQPAILRGHDRRHRADLRCLRYISKPTRATGASSTSTPNVTAWRVRNQEAVTRVPAALPWPVAACCFEQKKHGAVVV